LRALWGSILFYFHKPNSQKLYRQKIKHIIGYYPLRWELYERAFLHLSVNKNLNGRSKINSNERLEYLGDAVLDSVIAELVFKKFPFKGEGFLTEMRSKMVSRKQLADLARKMGIPEVLKTGMKRNDWHVISSLSGNALEALIGVVYLDKGYKFTGNFIYNRLITPYIDLNNLEDIDINYKSIVNHWVQKEKKVMEFKIIEKREENRKSLFLVALIIDNEQVGTGKHFSKKTAEKLAAESACKKLGLKPNDNEE
jgi:ribonuclease III